MKRMRFSIGGLMGFVLVAALGLGGLKAANEYWASGCYSLMVVVLVAAILNAVQCRGKDRAYWSGFAVTGGVCFLVAFGSLGPFRVTAPPLLTELLFNQLEPLIHPEMSNLSVSFTVTSLTATPLPPPMPLPSAPPVATAFVPTTLSPAPAPLNSSVTLLPPPAARFFAMPPSNMRLVHYSQVAHSLTALLVGMLGGLYSAWLFGRRERREAEPTPEISPSSP